MILDPFLDQDKKMFKGNILAALVIGVSFLTACETPAPRQALKLNWGAGDGSHANGMMKLTARAHNGIRFNWNDRQAEQVAAQRCQAWDYRGAELFGKTRKDCIKRIQDSDSCAIWEYSRNYSVYETRGSG